MPSTTNKPKIKITLTKVILFLILAPIFLFLLILFIVKAISPTQESKLIQSCPDAWYVNQIPQTKNSTLTDSEYFVYQGERIETHQVDIDWVTQNCSQNNLE